MNAQFVITSVQKCYGEKIALELKKLAIWPGRIYILTGPNGSGKSTLLNILALLSKPELGAVMYAGERVIWKSRELGLLRKKITDTALRRQA
jgi:ABC-type sugar transport system ATPase subunit